MAAFNITIRAYSNTGFVEVGGLVLTRVRDAGLTAHSAGVIRPTGVISPTRAVRSAGNHEYINRTTSSDLSGYKVLEESAVYRTIATVSASFPNAGVYPETIAIEEYATNSGVMNGVTADGATAKAIDIEAKKDVTVLEDVTVKIEVYKRHESGTEDLLASHESGLITTSFATYTFSPSLNARWTGGDRLVTKYLGVNYGVVAPP